MYQRVLLLSFDEVVEILGELGRRLALEADWSERLLTGAQEELEVSVHYISIH